MSPVLEVENLVVRFPSDEGEVHAVDDVSLEVAAGETLALVGESGCGKSTLAKAIAGLVPIRDGEIRLGGQPLLGLPRREARRRRLPIQMVFQDPGSSLDPRMSIEALVGEPLRLRGQRGTQLDERISALLERVGLDPALRRRYAHGVSGGQRQRIAIARALAVEPRLLLCDEVTSALDVSIQGQILNLLLDLQRELGLALLFITHDLAVVRSVAHRVAVMYLGEIVELRPTQALFEDPLHPYTQALLSALPRLAGGVRAHSSLVGEVPSPLAPPPGCRFHTRCPRAFSACVSEVPTRPGRGGDGIVRCHLPELAPSPLDELATAPRGK